MARIGALLLLFVACAPLHLATRWLTGRSSWPSRFLAAAAWICGVRVSVSGGPVRPHSLLVANHSSWLDILILGGRLGAAFVSKDRLGHGLLHWLADQNHTVYVRRDSRKGARDQAQAVAAALERSQPLAIFPEGTTGPGDVLLPFRSALIEAAASAGSGVEVRPVAIDFGAAAREVGWHGEPGRDNVLRLLNRRGRLAVTVHLLPPLPVTIGRKEMARRARDQIAAALGLQVGADLPYRPGE